MSTRETYKDPEFFIMNTDKDAFSPYCNTCKKHFRTEAEYYQCIQKHREDHRGYLSMRGDD